MENIKNSIKRIKRRVFEGRKERAISPTYGKVIYEELDKMLCIINDLREEEKDISNQRKRENEAYNDGYIRAMEEMNKK